MQWSIPRWSWCAALCDGASQSGPGVQHHLSGASQGDGGAQGARLHSAAEGLHWLHAERGREKTLY